MSDGDDPGPEFDDVVDPDVDVADPAQGRDTGRREAWVVAAVALGGVVGAEARYGLSEAITHDTGAWPWSTLLTNVIGSLLIGLLMVTVERRRLHHLVRPFLGVGMLGGFTTFSTFALDDQHLFGAGRPFVAIGYSAASLAGCLAATALGVWLARRVVTEAAA